MTHVDVEPFVHSSHSCIRFFSSVGDDENEVESPENLVTVEKSVPISSVTFGPMEVALPVKEESLPSTYKEKREVSEKELPQSRPSFEAVQVS